MPRSYEELLADLRSGLDKKPNYEERLDRFRARVPKPPPEPTVEEKGVMARAAEIVSGIATRRAFTPAGPDIFGTRYLDKPAPAPREVVDPSLIQRKTEDEIARGAKDVADKGGDVEEYVNRMHQLRYGKRIASLLKAGRDHANKLLREGATPDEAEAGGIDLAQKHIKNLENAIASGQQSR